MVELSIQNAILLKKAVTTVVPLSGEATINFFSDGLSLVASGTFLIMALRVQPSGFIDYRIREGASKEIDVGALFMCLSYTEEDDSLHIHFDEDENNIGFSFTSHDGNKIKYFELHVNEPDNGPANIRNLEFEYDLVVGIPARHFIEILLDRNADAVNILVTENEVRFSGECDVALLRKEDNACIIWGVPEGRPVNMVFSLSFLPSVVLAAAFASTVWILKSDNSPPVLNCPAAPSWNIMFYFIA